MNTANRKPQTANCFLLLAFCILHTTAFSQVIPPEIFGNYEGATQIAIPTLEIDETIYGINVELQNTNAENDYILSVPIEFEGVDIPVEMDYVIITPDGNGFKLSRANSITVIIPELEIPPLPPLFPDGGAFTNVPVEITLGNTRIEDFVMDLNLTAVATVTVIIFPVPITMNVHFVGILYLPPEIITEELPVGKVGEEYSATLEATGTPPISWNIPAEKLPVGLELDEETGIISGIPVDSGIFEFTVMAISDLGVADKVLSMEIKGEDIIDTTGILTANILQLGVYPNPTNGELQITNYELQITSVEILDVYGRRLLTYDFQLSTKINISHLPEGVYLVKIYTNKGTVTKKIIKE